MFLVFQEAMSMLLHASSVGIKGVTLRFSSSQLLDTKFADDASFYLREDSETSIKAEHTKFVTCKASSALFHCH